MLYHNDLTVFVVAETIAMAFAGVVVVIAVCPHFITAAIVVVIGLFSILSCSSVAVVVVVIVFFIPP